MRNDRAGVKGVWSMLIPSCAPGLKAQAIRWALTLAKEHSKCRVIIEGYCKICLDALNKKIASPVGNYSL